MGKSTEREYQYRSEQRHVDIYLNGAKTMKTRMEAILTKSSSCSELENVVRSIWASQQAETERAQDEFHLEDEAKTQNDRKPLQVQIDTNRTRLTAINSEIRGLEQTLDDLKRQRNTTHARIDAVKAQMAKSGASPPNCSQSRLTSSIQALCQQYNALVAAYNALADQHNGAGPSWPMEGSAAARWRLWMWVMSPPDFGLRRVMGKGGHEVPVALPAPARAILRDYLPLLSGLTWFGRY
jgi:chromosome segregation ATPase